MHVHVHTHKYEQSVLCVSVAALRHQGHVYLMEYWWYETLLQLSYLYHGLQSEYLKVVTIL